MTRHEAAILWQICLALRRKNYEAAEAMTRMMLRATIKDFTKEDAANDKAEADHDKSV